MLGAGRPRPGSGDEQSGARKMASAVAVSSAKRSLRAELKQRLRAMSAEERLRQSRLLAQKVMAHSQYQKSRRISIFLSMQDEVETKEIIQDIFQQGKTCFIPRYQIQSSHMDMVKLASPEEISSLPRTSWNIHQPGEDEVREEALSTAQHLPRCGHVRHVSSCTFSRLLEAGLWIRARCCMGYSEQVTTWIWSKVSFCLSLLFFLS
ncbi:5-formyltetrahydrofolate cyclo-ligase-like isoform X2 [Ursus americanus]|uniref:5-formyltetrahydrofolate cyclo-ligase-like isoform X2 n=1 Tax=Ursus americanus TaxID=9643 RepID=UPI001E67C12D|nr:5-formyltetrahydrofolate cyclo-ligase-like isoform X2 [Ursus americanus]